MTRRSLFSLLPAAACAQQSRPVLDLPQFEPRSTLRVAETRIERARFPLLDITRTWAGAIRKAKRPT